MKRLAIDGYGQLELNNVAFRRDGRVEAQCALVDTLDYVENGMLLAVDNISREVSLPDGNSELIALNYSSEHMYDERKPGLKNFRLDRGSFLPRLGYLSRGDKFTTNCIAFDEVTEFPATADQTADEVFMEIDPTATDYYGTNTTSGTVAGGAGAIYVSATKPQSGVVLKVIAATTMPDGQYALKFQAL